MLDGVRRVLIADDVGLGKTIEAGLIIAELRRRRSDARVLVVAPAGLRTQWKGELLGRFGIDAPVADAASIERVSAHAPRDDTPWSCHPVWIASLDYLKQPHVFDTLPLAPIDLVVIDEAHLACGASERHEAACAIAARARRVVLLTATPDSGRPHDRVALERMGALSGLNDPLVVFRRTRHDLHWPSRRTVRLHRVACSAAERAVFDLLTRFERVVLRTAGARHRDGAILLLAVFRKRALSTSAALGLSIERRLAYINHDAPPVDWMQPSLDFNSDADADALSEDERAGLCAQIGIAASRERTWLTRLARLTAVASMRESAFVRLRRLLERTGEPMVIFTEFRDSLDALRAQMQSVASVAVVHGGLDAAEQSREIGRFTSGDARLLLATDVASQGLNLQHRCRWVVSLDLPWNPVRLAQRAGRVDRIGQSKPVHVTLLARDHPADDALLCRLAQRVLGAERAMPGGELLQGALPDEAKLRAAIVAGAPLMPAAGESPSFVRSTRWVRQAGRVTGTLSRRRALIGQSDRVIPTGRPMVTRFGRAWPHGSVAVFSVGLINGCEAAAEQHVVAVRLDCTGTPKAVGAARALAKRSLEARARRIERLLRTQIRVDASRERAIAAVLTPPAGPGLQAGLFDRRAEARRDEARQRATEIADELARRLQSDAAGESVTVGDAQLEVLIVKGLE